MERLARVAEVVRQVARKAHHRLAITTPPRTLKLIADILDRPWQGARPLEGAFAEAGLHLLGIGIQRRPRMGHELLEIDIMPPRLGLAIRGFQDSVGIDRMNLKRGLIVRER
jgi:hypothetical protein